MINIGSLFSKHRYLCTTMEISGISSEQQNTNILKQDGNETGA